VELTAALLKSLDNQYRRLAEGRPDAQAAILRSFEERSSFARARHVEVEEDTGKYTGITEGLDRRGFLLVRTDDGVRTVLSGSVRALDRK
jgi:BirA family biotin operon repressor/biotin-[acetyl-CoA-carboxylase] ligase